MTIVHSTTATVLVAIDISKHRHEVLISIPGKKRRRRLTITNTLEDFQRLAIALPSYDLPVRIGFEATGNYHRALAHHLVQAGFELKLVSSVGLARTREALHNSWDKNDPKDAQVILHMLEISKYADYLPLYGQSQIFDRDGIDLSRSNLADWLNNRHLLEPIGNIPPKETEANFYAAMERSDMAA